MSDLIKLKSVTKNYGSLTALDNVSMSLSDSAPSMTAVAGESGSGKTTLARMMLGFISPTMGEILYRDKDIATMTTAEKWEFRREVQPIFQDPFDVFNPFYRIDHVLTTPVKRYRLADTKAGARVLIEDALSRVGLRPQDTLGRFPHELSGGQRQRIMVARAILVKPRLIIADEPVSMVDASLRATILDELRMLNNDLGISIIYITHDLTTAYQICENILILYQGAVAEAGSVDRVIREPKHPYTQLLVSSIPLINQTNSWGEIEIAYSSSDRETKGCRFAPRCAHALEMCWSDNPAKYLPEPDRLASCFLYRDNPGLDNDDVSNVFSKPAAVGEAQMVAPAREL